MAMQTFLAAEFVDSQGVMELAKETLFRLLNHPNLVSIVDIVQEFNAGASSRGYTVWEDCNKGTLNRRLWHESGEEVL